MLVFPNCKINLGLNVTGKRPDGYHNIETVFFPVKWYDVLEAIDPGNNADHKLFTSSGIKVLDDDADNICLKALQLLKKDFAEQLARIALYLHKTIPAGGGLGGGSADGAFTLKLLNKQFKLDLTEDQLLNYAKVIGSDCPFFIVNTPCLATGRGELLDRITVDLSSYKLILIYPNIHVSTKDAFSLLTPGNPNKSISEIIRQPITSWKEELINDFERSVFEKYPAIAAIKQQLYRNGALYASMTGSGSTVYGIFPKEQEMSNSYPDNYIVKELRCQAY